MSTELCVWLTLSVATLIGVWLLPLRPAKVSNQPGTPRSPLDSSERKERWIELLRLEYEKAADRYGEIYGAIWQNFSYMAVVAGGILTFGSRELGSQPTLYFLALTPLFFWLVATFLPMDHYGDAIRTRLRAIEEDINRVYFPGAADPKLAHFRLFEGTHYKWRVRTVIRLFGIAITIGWLYSGVLFVSGVVTRRGTPMTQRQTLELEAKPLRIELED